MADDDEEERVRVKLKPFEVMEAVQRKSSMNMNQPKTNSEEAITVPSRGDAYLDVVPKKPYKEMLSVRKKSEGNDAVAETNRHFPSKWFASEDEHEGMLLPQFSDNLDEDLFDLQAKQTEMLLRELGDQLEKPYRLPKFFYTKRYEDTSHSMVDYIKVGIGKFVNTLLFPGYYIWGLFNRQKQDLKTQTYVDSGLPPEGNMTTKRITGAEQITAVVQENNMEAFMSLEDTFVKAYPHYKSSWRLLHIVAVYGTAEMIDCMKRWTRIDWDRQHTIHEDIFKGASRYPKVKEATALYLATCLERTETVRSLVKLAGEDNIRSCLQGLTLSNEIEHVFMLELADRLRQKHAGLKPTIVPGHQNEGNGTRSRVFIVYSVSVVQTEDYDFNGLGLVKLRNPYVLKKAKTSSSGETVLSQKDVQRVKEAIRTHRDRLWLRHSNLNIITGRYVKTKINGLDIDTACVLLYCSTKGVIPLGEEEFPRTLCIKNDNRINVVVREGFFRFGGYMTDSSSRRHSTLKMGCEIGRLTPQYDASGNRIPNSCGTLGPFVLYNNNPGFISCSHVFFDMPTNAYALNFSAQQIVEVVQPSTDSTASVNNTACGVVARAVFAPNHPTSIDAAVVVLTDRSRVPSAGHFSNQHRSSYINAGFNELPEYNNALTLGRSGVNTLLSKPTVIKFGSKTDVTRGSLSVVGTDVRPFATKVGVSGSSDNVLMKNQYLVTGNYPSMDFCDGGDSGSAVFCQDVNGQLVCVGMAIGHCVLNDFPHKSGIVTPIDAILQALGPNITLATFL